MLASELAPATVRGRLEHEGFHAGEEVVLLALAGADEAVDELRRRLRAAGVPHLLATGADTHALLPAARLDDRLLPADGRLHAGASRPLGPQDGLELARREATLALDAALRSGATLSRFAAEHASVLPVDRPSLERLVESVLGPLLRYDAAHRTALVASLRCYLECDRSLRDASARLFVHANTLAYRLRRVEELTGRRLAGVEAQTDLWLALRAQAMLSGRPPVGSADFVARDN
jgi:purine catabolism regulator